MTTLPNRQLNDDDLELLSAYIDNQLAPGERGALEERMRREPALHRALEELRGTVALLHDLPPITAPRSFTLDPAAFAPRRSPLFSWLRMGASLASVLLVLTFAVDFVAHGRVVPTSAPASAPLAGAPSQQRSALTFPTSGLAAGAPPAAPGAEPQAAEAPAASAPMVAAAATSAPAATEAPAAAIAPQATTVLAPSALEASGAITRSADANAGVAPTTAPQATLAFPGQPDLAGGAAPLASPAAPVATSDNMALGGTELTQPTSGSIQPSPAAPPISPIRLVELGLAALALLLGLGAFWVRRRESQS